MKKHLLFLVSLLVIASMMLAACAQSTPTTAPEPAAQEPTDAPEPVAEEPTTAPEPVAEEPTTAPEPEPAGDKVQIRWFVGLGSGTNPDQVAVQEEVVADFNAMQDEIELVLEIVPYDSARDTLSTQIASGNGPDIIGPVGWGGSNAFYGQWLDLSPYIESTGFDTSVFDPALVKFYQTEEGQVGLPFAVFPAAVYYVPSMFDEAGLNYPPAAYGDPYVWPDGTEEEWSWETLAKVARMLTVDVNGNNATDDGFDRTQIVQVGFVDQWMHPNHLGSFFGAAKLYDDENNAVIPDSFRAAWEFKYDAMWGEQPFMPTGALAGSPEFGTGNVFNSGKAAMAITHMWYTCCLSDFKNAGYEFQLGVLPTYNGEVHGRVDADTFRIWKGTQHPEEAFTVLSYLIGDGGDKLLPTYGAMPAIDAKMTDFLAAKSNDYPFVTTWDPMLAGLAYPDNPSGEGYMPNWNEAWNRIQTFGDLMNNTEDLDLAAEIDTLQADLTAIFQK